MEILHGNRSRVSEVRVVSRPTELDITLSEALLRYIARDPIKSLSQLFFLLFALVDALYVQIFYEVSP